MKLFLIGATGRTGTHILELALARGHQVTAFVRSPQKITRKAPGLTVIQGDPLRVEQLAQVMPGHDAVLSTLGPSGREGLRPSTLVAESAASMVAAMQQSEVRRLAIVSAAPLFPSWNPLFVVFRWVLRHHLRDLTAMEAVVRATPFEWTIARPPRLVESADERYVAEDGAMPRGRMAMSFRAVAKAMLDVVDQHSHVRAVVGLAGPRGGQ